MDRKEFLALVGIAAGGAFVTACLGGCRKEDDDDAPSNQQKDFTLDLNAADNAALRNNGGFVVTQGVIVARTNAGDYIAVSSTCTHQGSTVGFQAATNRFRCPNHGAEFNADGSVARSPATTGLQRFNTTLNGNSLRIFS
jgi:cytochrome b6-f complex iron-sulfur subunit